MSRRLRLEEQERLRSKKDVLEEDLIKLRKERIEAPILWQRIPPNFKIIDLKPCFYEETLSMIKEYDIPENVVTRNAEVDEDPESIDSLIKKAAYFLKETCSIAAVEEVMPPPSSETDLPQKPIETLAGVMILKPIFKIDHGGTFLSVLYTAGKAQKKIIDLYGALQRSAKIEQQMKCDSYLTILYVIVKPEYKKAGLKLRLMQSSLDIARSLHLPVVTGQFPSLESQQLAKKIGMKVLYEINYVDWRDRNGNVIFPDPGAGNYTCALMATKVPSEPSKEHQLAMQIEKQFGQSPSKDVRTESNTVKLTRIQKRELLAKEQAKQNQQSK